MARHPCVSRSMRLAAAAGGYLTGCMYVTHALQYSCCMSQPDARASKDTCHCRPSTQQLACMQGWLASKMLHAAGEEHATQCCLEQNGWFWPQWPTGPGLAGSLQCMSLHVHKHAWPACMEPSPEHQLLVHRLGVCLQARQAHVQLVMDLVGLWGVACDCLELDAETQVGANRYALLRAHTATKHPSAHGNRNSSAHYCKRK